MIEIHAYHGWGFDGSFWNYLQAELSIDILFKAANRGYFGKQYEPVFSKKASTKIVFTHSFGLHWCAKKKLNEINYLVIFNGFYDFLSQDSFERKIDLKTLNRMHNQFTKTPIEVLRAFYKNCFHPHIPILDVPSVINKSLLEKDLLALKNTKFVNPNSKLQIISISGIEDQIIPNQKTKDLITNVGINETNVYDGFGHATPVVNSSNCWSYLSKVLPIFSDNLN